MSLLTLVRVDGVPGPKGSLNAFCVRCAKRHLKPAVVVQEQSEVGERFRKVVGRKVKLSRPVLEQVAPAFEGDVETRLIFFIPRQHKVRNGVELDEWVPSHAGPRPTHRNSGDVEKHVRTVHDALMDAGVIKDDSQVWRTVAEKRWATSDDPPGVVVEVITA